MALLSVDKVFRFVQFVSNKESRGWVSPEEFNLQAEVAQLTLYSEFESVYAATKKIEANMRPFVKSSIGLGDNSGVAGLRILISAFVSTSMLPVKEVDVEEVPNIVNSALVPPTEEYPICWIEDVGAGAVLRTIPDAISVDIKYLEAPTAPEWTYDASSGRPIYDNAGTDFSFDETLFIEISMRILSGIGINIGKDEVTQYAEALKQQK